jgi:hypothetical protein
MTTDNLLNLIEVASTAAERIFKHRGELLPMYHCIDADGREHLVPMPPGHNKDQAVAIMRAYFELHHIVRYVFMDEAWTLVLAPGEVNVETVMRNGITADYHDRIEVIIFSGEDEIGLITAQRKIRRPAKGKPTLGPLEIMSNRSDRYEGRMVGLLPRKGGLQ